jgi:NADH-quinone oxidoreductase subunit L
MTHAFFKALLFLAAGSVIHALSGEQDMRVMGGLRKRIPITFWTMSAGVFAIAGIYPLSGFFSKDEILFQTFSHGGGLYIVLWLIGLLTAGLTSFYMFRLWFKTFFGAPRFEESDFTDHGHGAAVHESPLVMTIPLIVLALLAVAGGWVGIPAALGGHNEFEHFLAPVFAAGTRPGTYPGEVQVHHTIELLLAVISLCVAAIGFFAAYLCYIRKPGTAAELAAKYPYAYSLLDHKYWVDEIYGRGIVNPLLTASRLLLNGFVDGALVQGATAALAGSTRGLGFLVRRMQSGNIRSYAGWLALGAAAVIAMAVVRH